MFVDNIFIGVGKSLYLDSVSVSRWRPDGAPLIANLFLFLFYYEYNFMKGLIKTNINLLYFE